MNETPPPSMSALPAEPPPPEAGAAPAHPTFGEAFRYWLTLGFLNFGGPAGQIALMHRDLVERRRWISEKRFLHALNFCMLLPGPEATQLATYVGWLLHRRKGGLAAGVLFILPSVFVLLALSYLYAAYGNVAVVAGVLAGFKPAVVAIVLEAVLRIGKRALKRPPHLAIAVAAFVGLHFLAVPFPLIVLGAGLIGVIGERVRPSLFAPAKVEENQEHAPVRYVLDDDTPPPPHAVPSRARALMATGVALVLWIVPYVALLAWRGEDSLHAQQYRFFSVAAFVTFGGAYAVLTYVTKAAVTTFGWMSQAQTVDGLALAETTPGPLIMVLQFIGFMAGWNHPEGLPVVTSAVVGALVTTWTTFLPTYLLVFLGAPYIESLRGNRVIAAALGGITAAVVGVILTLALVFGEAVLFPSGLRRSPDLFALAVAAVSFVVLFRFKKNVTWVILGGGFLGLVRRLLP
jgi:chromate transporter